MKNRYNQEELDIVRELYPTTSTRAIAEKLNKDVKMISNMATVMGLHKSPLFSRIKGRVKKNKHTKQQKLAPERIGIQTEKTVRNSKPAKTTNTGITLVDARTELMDAIKKVKRRELGTQEAEEVRKLIDTLVLIAQTQVNFLNAIPDEVKKKLSPEEFKAIAGTLYDRDAELDTTMHQIKHPQLVDLSKK